jgi:hypothetical protein
VALHEDYVALFVEEGADLDRGIRGEKRVCLRIDRCSSYIVEEDNQTIECEQVWVEKMKRKSPKQ